jgi:phage gpG-like protein
MSLGIDAFVADLLKFSENNNREPLYEEIGEILVASIEKNFREGGRYGIGDDGEFVGGSTHWIESKRALKQSGKTLVDTAQLSTSITYEATASGVEVGTNKIYGAIQHFGGETGKDKAVTLLPRPYLVIQDEDLEAIAYAAERFFHE